MTFLRGSYLQLHSVGRDNSDNRHAHAAAHDPDLTKAGWCCEYTNSDEHFQHVESSLESAHVSRNGTLTFLVWCFELFDTSGRDFDSIRIVTI